MDLPPLTNESDDFSTDGCEKKEASEPSKDIQPIISIARMLTVTRDTYAMVRAAVASGTTLATAIFGAPVLAAF